MLSPIQLVQSARTSIKECDNSTLCQSIDDKHLIIDVREPNEYSQGHIANAINMPRGIVEFAIFQHPRIKPAPNQADLSETNITVYCKSGGRSALVAQSLQAMGFKNVTSLRDGIIGWENEGLFISKEDSYQY